MNVFSIIKDKIFTAVLTIYPECADFINIVVEIPKDPNHGDISTNVAMILQKSIGKSPREIAQNIATALNDGQMIVDIQIAGPGFLNLKLSNDLWLKLLSSIIFLRSDYGASDIGAGRHLNIEFVSANPTGPMHIGHSRGAIIGDAISRIMAKCGYKITKEYYINDAGSQIATLAESVYIRYMQALGMDEQIPDGAYPGQYLISVGEALKDKYAESLLSMNYLERNTLVREFAINAMMKLIRSDLKLLKVHHDVFTSEQQSIHASGKIAKTLDFMQDKGLLYKGVLEPPKGKQTEEWEPREQLLFKSKEFGDDVDRALVKSNGDYTYFAADIAYHMDKVERGFDELILLLGADHAGYVKRMKAVVAALTDHKMDLDVKVSQLVNLFKEGAPYKMSKRSGNFVTVADVVEDLGADVLRFMMLSRKNDTVFDFDIDKAQEQTKDNPVFYVQYANARAHSVLRLAKESGLEPDVHYLSHLKDDSDFALIRKLAEFPKVMEAACIHHEPHRITFYLIELADTFHSYWALGNDNLSMRFISSNHDLSRAKLAIAKGVVEVITSGLDVIGVKALERM